MAENKNSFIAYCDWKFIFDELSDEQAGKLIKHLLAYVNDASPEVQEPVLKIAFASIKSTLKRDLNRWERIREKRVTAGRKGGLASVQAKASKCKQVQANQAVSVSVSDSVSVIEGEGKKTKPPQLVKKKHGEFILLTDEEFEKLKMRFPDSLDNRIKKLDFYLGSTGKKYKSHYHTILSWAEKDKEDESKKNKDEEMQKYFETKPLPVFVDKYGEDNAWLCQSRLN